MEISVLSEILKAAAIAALPAFFGLVAALFSALRAWIEANTRSTWLQVINREALEVVAAVAQTVAGPTKEAAADGKLSGEDAQRIKQIALDTLRTRLALIPAHLFPDLEKRLSDAVEASVKQSKGA